MSQSGSSGTDFGEILSHNGAFVFYSCSRYELFVTVVMTQIDWKKLDKKAIQIILIKDDNSQNNNA